MNRKLITLVAILTLGATLTSGCVAMQSSAAEPAPVTVAPVDAPPETVAESPVPTAEPTPEPTPTPEPEPPAIEEPVSYDYEGWISFESARFGYAFLAPPNAEVMENDIDGTVNLSGPLAGNERTPPCITIFSHDSDFFRPPAGTDVVAWVAESPIASGEVESSVEIGGQPSAHLVTPDGPGVNAGDEYYVINGDRLIRIVITHCGHEDWDLYDAFLASFTFDGVAAPVGSDCDRESFRAGLILEARSALDALPGASIYHIDLEIPSDFRTLQGYEWVHYTNQEGVALEEIYFQLFPNVTGGSTTIDMITVDGGDVETRLLFEESTLEVTLPAPLAPGEQVAIEMAYTIEIPHEMGDHYGIFGYFDEVLALNEFAPVIPVYDDEGWNVRDPASVGDMTYLDASFYVVRVVAPPDLTLVTSGVEVAREAWDGGQTVTFAAGPARTFYIAASEQFAVVSETVGETTVNSYALPGYEDGAELALEVAADALRSFNARFGTYPYTEFDVVSTPMLALGIEYPGVTGIALGVYDPEASPGGMSSQAVLEGAVAHEVAHQWFYNGVGNDQVDEPWLDEALAQYLTALYYTDTSGADFAQGYIDSWGGHWDRVGRAEIPVGLSCTEYDDSNYSAIVYGRGPLFLRALSAEMGQETFDAFLRDYYQSYLWGIGTTEAFRTLAEQHCECDLTDLFEEWVY